MIVGRPVLDTSVERHRNHSSPSTMHATKIFQWLSVSTVSMAVKWCHKHKDCIVPPHQEDLVIWSRVPVPITLTSYLAVAIGYASPTRPMSLSARPFHPTDILTRHHGLTGQSPSTRSSLAHLHGNTPSCRFGRIQPNPAVLETIDGKFKQTPASIMYASRISFLGLPNADQADGALHACASSIAMA